MINNLKVDIQYANMPRNIILKTGHLQGPLEYLPTYAKDRNTYQHMLV